MAGADLRGPFRVLPHPLISNFFCASIQKIYKNCINIKIRTQ